MKLVEDYLHDLRSIHYSDAGTDELTYYHPLLNLLNALGRTLKPRVTALGNLADAGVGHPDIGLFSESQAQGGLPERGVIEVKGTAADVAGVAGSEQVARYLSVYRQVLVTNYWDFVLVGREGGRPATLESFRLAESEADFWRKAAQPRKLAHDQGEAFLEYLKRVMLRPTILSRPRDVAWFLASYARDALSRLADGALPGLAAIGVAAREGGGGLNPAAGDLALSAGWGYAGQRGVTMPGQGRLVERGYTAEERAAIQAGAGALGLEPEQALDLLGQTTYDVYLNDVAYWRNIPAHVWDYTLGGYQVIKKWLSYRERALLGRDLKPEEVMEVAGIARRIAALILTQPELDGSYEAVKAVVYDWP